MKFENIHVYNFEGALHGMRNPKNSWNLSDSFFGLIDPGHDVDLQIAEAWTISKFKDYSLREPTDEEIEYFNQKCEWLWNNGILKSGNDIYDVAFIGPKDMKLAQTLIKAGPEHRKFLRQIFVSVDITAPLYWWKEADTYKVATVANSTSTMHKLANTPITLENFEIDDYSYLYDVDMDNSEKINAPNAPSYWTSDDFSGFIESPDGLISWLEELRRKYNITGDKRYWKELIRWLPEGWLQTRTWTCNYETLLAICSKSQRRFHKLIEWSGDGENFINESFIKFARSLPYAKEFIFIDEEDS